MPAQVVGGKFREPRGWGAVGGALGDSALARPSPCPPVGASLPLSSGDPINVLI